MREDTVRLLELIGDRNFPYKEFPFEPTETDSWPLFAAIGEQLSTSKPAGGDAREAAVSPAPTSIKVEALAAGLRDRPAPPPAPAPAQAGSFLARYTRAEPTRANAAHDDVGAFLRNLAASSQ